MFKVKVKKNYDLGIAKFVAVRPWMLEYKWDTAEELYVFAYVWNCIDHFGQLRMDTQGDLNRCSMYINVEPEVLTEAIESLIKKHYIEAEEFGDETFLLISIGTEWLGTYEGFSNR